MGEVHVGQLQESQGARGVNWVLRWVLRLLQHPCLPHALGVEGVPRVVPLEGSPRRPRKDLVLHNNKCDKE